MQLADGRRLVDEHFSGARRLCAAWAAASALLCASALSGNAAADEVDIAVQAVVFSGSIAGVPVGEPEIGIVKSAVRCALAQDTVARCAFAIVRDRLPEEAASVSDCLFSGSDAETCLIQEAVARFPPEAAAIALCVNSGAPATDCAKTALLNALPSDAIPVADCIASGGDVGRCVSKSIEQTAYNQALLTLDKLRADARSELGSLDGGAFRNILDVVSGIRDNDWPRVFIAGGGEVYKAALRIALRIALPEVAPIGEAVDPVINAIVQSRIDVAQDVLTSIHDHDAAALGRNLVEVYLTEDVVGICAVPMIPDDVREATCGELGKVIHVVGSIVEDALNVVGDVFKAAGSAVEDVITLFVKQHDCGTPEQYYRENYAQCYERGALTAMSSMAIFEAAAGELNHRCRVHYDRCVFSGDFDRLCNPQRDLYRPHVLTFASALQTSAAAYSRTFGGFVASKGQQAACRADAAERLSQAFLRQCETDLQTKYPDVAEVAAAGFCADPAANGNTTAYRQACEGAMLGIDQGKALFETCHPPEVPSAPGKCKAMANGHCGFLSVNCDRPLPPAASYLLAGDPRLGTFRSVPSIGLVEGLYHSAPGDRTLRVCAQDRGGIACSQPFVTTFDTPDSSCEDTHVPVEPLCSPTEKLCPGHGCIPRNRPCDPLQ